MRCSTCCTHRLASPRPLRRSMCSRTQRGLRSRVSKETTKSVNARRTVSSGMPCIRWYDTPILPMSSYRILELCAFLACAAGWCLCVCVVVQNIVRHVRSKRTLGGLQHRSAGAQVPCGCCANCCTGRSCHKIPDTAISTPADLILVTTHLTAALRSTPEPPLIALHSSNVTAINSRYIEHTFATADGRA